MGRIEQRAVVDFQHWDQQGETSQVGGVVFDVPFGQREVQRGLELIQVASQLRAERTTGASVECHVHRNYDDCGRLPTAAPLR